MEVFLARETTEQYACCYTGIQDDIRNAGGNWIDQEVVRDRNWVSSRSPRDLGAFNSAMIALFAENKLRVSR